MKKIFKLAYIFWSLKSKANRRRLLIAFDKYYKDTLKPPQPLPVQSAQEPADSKMLESRGNKIPDSPYNKELLDLSTKSKFLLITHEFSRTGAPYAVLYLAKALCSLYGTRPLVLSPEDGPIREEFESQGFRTIIDPKLFKYESYPFEACSFVSSFERIIVSSLSSYGFVSYFRGIAKNLVWWIHETDTSFNSFAKNAIDLSILFAACEAIWLVSPLCFPYAIKYTSPKKVHLLLYGLQDAALQHRPNKLGKIIFTIVGSITPRKGQDVFLDAIDLLPDELKNKAIFRIIGSSILEKRSKAYYENICDRANRMPNVECIDSMPQEKLLEFYAETNVLVSCSREDPMPIVITEALMFSIACLCSSSIGQAELLEDKKTGLIFISESAEQLSNKMIWAIENQGKLQSIGEAGRKVFEKYFLLDDFANNLADLTKNFSNLGN